MGTTRWSEVVSALVDLARALPECRTPGEDAPADRILVLDGLEVFRAGDDAPRVLVVGMSLDDDTEQGDSGQVIATLGTHSRDESGAVRCTAVAQAGSGIDLPDAAVPDRVTARSLRESAFGVMAAVEALIRADVTLGLGGRQMVAQMGTRIVPRQMSTDTGDLVLVEFDVTYRARI